MRPSAPPMMLPRSGGTAGFTLVEVALAMGVLVIGLSAVTSIYLTGLRWVNETRHQYTTLLAARTALHSPEVLLDSRHGSEIGTNRTDDRIAGWFNGYYCVRSIDNRERLGTDDDAWCDITVEVYSGGTDADGELVQVVRSGILLYGRH